MAPLYYDVIVLGGGAAGFFAAIQAKQLNPKLKIIILESAPKVLGKVKISGGGRCNVMHACFDVDRLIEHYPRGQKALKSIFSRFGPTETKKWFLHNGVQLKTENDNRMFPVTDDSQTIIDTLIQKSKSLGIEILTQCKTKQISKQDELFSLITDKQTYYADNLILATGSAKEPWEWLKQLGHKIIQPVPSLFTFNITDKRLNELQGLSFTDVQLKLSVKNKTEKTEIFRHHGPLLITHWGLSGPAVLKLSAWGARALHQSNYQGQLQVNFLPLFSEDEIITQLKNAKMTEAKKRISNHNPFEVIPKRYWNCLLDYCEINSEKNWADLSDKEIRRLTEELRNAWFNITGKGPFKEEFVTAGGVDLKEIDFKTMQSKLIPALFFAGEIIDIDGLTGGFNFQNAWSTGWIAGSGAAYKT